MVMKLLTQTQLQQTKNDQSYRDIVRTQEIDKATKKLKQDLAKAEADFNSMLATNRTKWVAELEEHGKLIEELKGEIAELEQKKAQVLVPLKMYEEQLNEKSKAIEAKAQEIANTEDCVEDLRELLEEKLDRAGQREQDAIKLEQKATALRLSAEEQSIIASEGMKTLNRKIEEFIESSRKKEKELRDRETSITLQERTIESKLKSLQKQISP